MKKNTFQRIRIIFLLLIISKAVHAQATLVDGQVYNASGIGIQSAVVTFLNAADTSINFITQTDSLGYYKINLSLTAITRTHQIETGFDLAQNYPNPFSSSTTIQYALKEHGDVHITIYDLLGRIVRKYDIGKQFAGTHIVQWDGKNACGQRVATGLYFCKLEVAGRSKVTKMLLSDTGNGGATSVFTSTGRIPAGHLSKTINLQNTSFIVKIDNNANTYPVVVTNQFDIVLSENDTTLNFSVNSVPVAEIYPDSLMQYIRGFGAANIRPWREDMTDSDIQTAFGTGDGQLGFSILRLRLPSATGWDWSIQVSTAKKAYDMGVLVFASPWSPPADYKSNNNTTGGYLLENHYQDYVDYLNSFIDYMSDNGISLYAVSVQNEPDITVTYESCDYSPDQMRNFVAGYADQIKTKVMAPESFQFRKDMSDPFLNDSTACANVDIIGGHIYGGGLESYPLAEEKGKEIWMTEHLTGSGNTSGPTWTEAMEVAMEINDCMNAGMSAYIWWYIIRFYGPISDGEYNSGSKGDITKKGYVMSQYSRFIRPGYHRVFCDKLPQRYVNVSSYKNDDGKLVIVAINQKTSSLRQTFILSDENITLVTPYTTSSTKNCIQGNNISVVNGRFTPTLDASSITTFVSN